MSAPTLEPGLRNGHRSRLLSTPAGNVQLAIPEARIGSVFPSLLEPRRRVCPEPA
jgi:transposase-like protein